MSGARNCQNESSKFLETETDKMVQFLGPETFQKCEFLGPETVEMSQQNFWSQKLTHWFSFWGQKPYFMGEWNFMVVALCRFDHVADIYTGQ